MNVFITSVVGFLCGVFASMGLGGGFLFVLYFALFTDTQQQSTQAFNLLFFIPIACLSLFFHFKNKLIQPKPTIVMALSGILFVFFGFAIARNVESEVLRKMFAVFTIFVGVKDCVGSKKTKNKPVNIKSLSDNIKN